MRTTLLTLAAVFASTAASAQSNVTISGFLDLAVGKAVGTADKAVQESSVGNSRITFRGREELGDGWAALFGFEHRLRPDTGTEGVPGRFWSGYSTLGLTSPYGTMNLGRQYTPSYSLVQNQVDPFDNVTIANLRDIGMRPGAAIHGLTGSPPGVAAVAKIRVSDSIRYDKTFGGFAMAASIGESQQESGTATGPNQPWSVAANYSTGPFFIGVGYEDPQFDNDHQWNVAARYKFGNVNLMAGGAGGRTANDLPLSGWLVGVKYTVGVGEVRAGYGRSKVGEGAGAVERRRLGVGYQHNLSKRTRIFADVAHETEIQDNKTGYDLGLVVSF